MAKSELIQKVRQEIQRINYPNRTEEAYIHWITRFTRFCGTKHPSKIQQEELERFLTYWAVEKNVKASTQHQVYCAIAFLYEQVLEQSLPHPNQWTSEPQRLPVILTLREIDQIFQHLEGVPLMITKLLYYSNLDISEATRIRVRELYFSGDQLTIRNGKGRKGRGPSLPPTIIKELRKQIQKVQLLLQKDMERGYGGSVLPKRLAAKHPDLANELGWQYLFPSFKISKDFRSGLIHRHQIPDTFIQLSIYQAAKQASVFKPISSRILSHSFVWHLLHNGYDLQTVQALFGYIY